MFASVHEDEAFAGDGSLSTYEWAPSSSEVGMKEGGRSYSFVKVLLAAVGFTFLAAAIGYGTASVYYHAFLEPATSSQSEAELGVQANKKEQRSPQERDVGAFAKDNKGEEQCEYPMILDVQPRAATWLSGAYSTVRMTTDQNLHLIDGGHPSFNIAILDNSKAADCGGEGPASQSCCITAINDAKVLVETMEMGNNGEIGLIFMDTDFAFCRISQQAEAGNATFQDIECSFTKNGDFTVTTTKNIQHCFDGHSFNLQVGNKNNADLTSPDSALATLQPAAGVWAVGDYRDFNSYIVQRSAEAQGLHVPLDRKVYQGDVLRFRWTSANYVSLVAVSNGNNILYDKINFKGQDPPPSVYTDCIPTDYSDVSRGPTPQPYWQFRSLGEEQVGPNGVLKIPLLDLGWHYFASITQTPQPGDFPNGFCELGQKFRVYVWPNPKLTINMPNPDPNDETGPTDPPGSDPPSFG